MADTGKPMRLKDLLQLDRDSCSASGFRCYPRRLGDPSPTPCRSPSSLRRSSKLSYISRSLSYRLRGSFWWPRSNDEEEEADDPAVRDRGSEQYTSPSECSDSSGGTTRPRSESDSYFSLASSASENMHSAVDTAGDEHEDGTMKKRGAREEGSSSGSEADDKEQLSPVAVMDFPCFDHHCSPSSDDSLLSRLQGERKTHTIRRFGSLDELGPVELEARLAASPDADDQDDDVPALQLQRHAEETTQPRPTSSCHLDAGVHDEPDANGLLVLLMDTVSAGVDAVSERLLLDLFVEMKVERRSERAGLPAPAGLLHRQAEQLGDGEILAGGRGWSLDGAGWGLEDVLRGGEAVMAEMERGRRWMQVGEEREVGTVVAGC